MEIISASVQLLKGEIALAGLSCEEERRIALLEHHRILPDSELKQMEFLFKMFKKPCFARGELVGVFGKAKSGKTFVCSILMALCFRNQVLSVNRIAPRRLHVLWYDTEQSEESTQDILRNRILPMTGLSESQFPKELFDVFNVRGEPCGERLPLLETAVNHYKPDLVILDGIRDLLSDINDGVVSHEVIERLMHLASKQRCCIVCVIHQNKSAEDHNPRGWIGTELKHKAFEMYECTKSSERIFAWSQVETRKYDILDKLKFAVNEQGIPYCCTEEQLLEAQYAAQRRLAEERQKSGDGSKLFPFNPKYVVGKDGIYTQFNVQQLFADAMEVEKVYTEEQLLKTVGLLSNIAVGSVLQRQLNKALKLGVIMQSYDACQQRIYVRPKPKPEQRKPIETKLIF
ncbi:MAG: AAA family ATPase [Paludibacteraceae bacterium]|nr:AAA family ATPase [Paludibacteraceae bacterium]MBQ8715662.1 AAA family ATPase [Prevotella sp.]